MIDVLSKHIFFQHPISLNKFNMLIAKVWMLVFVFWSSLYRMSFDWNFLSFLSLIPKELIAILEFWSRSYGMSLEPIFFILLGLILLFEIYLGI